MDHKGTASYVQLVHPEVMLEFLVPQRGRETDKPFDLSQWGVNAQPLRFMDIALMNPVRLMFEDVPVRVPHPACFALQKLLVAPRRKEAAKKDRDIESAVELINLLLNRNDQRVLGEVFSRRPASWRRTALKTLDGAGQNMLSRKLAELTRG